MSSCVLEQRVAAHGQTFSKAGDFDFKMNSDLIIYLPQVKHVVVIHFFFFPLKKFILWFVLLNHRGLAAFIGVCLRFSI